MNLTASEFHEWWGNPVTQNFLIELNKKREEVKENWAQQAYIDLEDVEKSARLNLYALASIDVLGQIIELVEAARPQQEEQ